MSFCVFFVLDENKFLEDLDQNCTEGTAAVAECEPGCDSLFFIVKTDITCIHLQLLMG